MIEVNNISFKYAGQKDLVFDDFSLRLEENNIYGLLGKYGTGKSTLLYLIAGLLRAKRGTVSFDGIETYKRKAETLQEIFIVPEEFDLPSMTLEQYVRINEPFYPRFSREVLEACLKDFELTEQREESRAGSTLPSRDGSGRSQLSTDLQLGALSMGQKKKVFMSFALAAGTKLLLMDEPTNGLDIPSKSQFRKVVTQYMTEERTLIISTHQVHDVESLLDHILILSQQRLLLDASVAEIQQKYTFEYRAAVTSPNPSCRRGTDEDVLYAEPSLQGNAVIAPRKAGSTETQINLELLFNAVNEGRITI